MNRKQYTPTIITATLFLSTLLANRCQAQHLLKDFIPTYYVTTYTSLGCEQQGLMAHAQFRNEFCTREMMHKQLDFNWCNGEHLWSNSLIHIGYTHYGHFQFSTGYGHLFGKKLAIGMRAVYELEHATHYPTRHSFTIDCSGSLKIGNKTILALYLFNPIRMRYGIISDEVMPTKFSLCCIYQTGEKVALTGFATLTLPFQPEIGIHLHWQPIPNLAFITHGSNSKTGLTILLHSKSMTFSIASDWFYRAGISPEANFYFLH